MPAPRAGAGRAATRASSQGAVTDRLRRTAVKRLLVDPVFAIAKRSVVRNACQRSRQSGAREKSKTSQ
eukprot:4363733-Prymnesium_polylepis.1